MFLEMVKTFKNWPVHYWAKVAHPKKVTYELRNGIEIELRANTMDKAIIKDVFIRDIYSPEGFEIKPGDTVIDIGGHIGMFSVDAASKVKPGGRVFVFEPAPENYRMLLRNKEINGLDNITAINKGVTATDGQASLFMSQQNTGGHSLHLPEEGAEELGIEVASLPSIMSTYDIEKIDYLKLDCEGAEFDILFNLSDDMFEKIEKIGMESHAIDDEKNNPKMLELLKSKGYKVFHKENAPDVWMIYAKR